jgi:lipopolysaccharide/colanic/teichoic acid biosynthesis glycosyltransferase
LTPTSTASIVPPLRFTPRAPTSLAAREPRRILAQDLFHSILRKERKQAVRARQSVVLVLISIDRRTAEGASFRWQPVIETVESATRDSDVIGWFAERTVLGVIQTDIGTTTETGTRAAEQRLRRALEAAQGSALRIRFHRITPAADDETAWPADARQTVNRAIKRVLDVVGSVALLILLSPLLLLIALLVKSRSAGPLLFGQTRIGEGMKPFTMLKFRTMYTGADQTLHREYVTRFIKSGSEPPEPGSVVYKITADPRVTPVGRFLRKTSLDELPQLWNVLRGEMSLVGPRPPLAYEVEQYQAWHCRRVVDAKPGITGLWQVAGRSRTTFDEMVRLDLRYARTCSLWTDVKILLATPRAVISGKGAC